MANQILQPVNKQLGRFVVPLLLTMFCGLTGFGQAPESTPIERINKVEAEIAQPAALSGQKAQPDTIKEQLGQATERALKTRPSGPLDLPTPASVGVQLLGIEVNAQRQEVVVNLTLHLLNFGTEAELEHVLQHIVRNLSEVELGWQRAEYRILLDGRSLKEILRPHDDNIIRDAEPLKTKPTKRLEQSQSIGPLSGKRIVVNPGHGWYWKESTRSWALQRDYFQNIVEDSVNAEMVMMLNEELNSTGAEVVPTRNLDKKAGSGETGHPMWEEAAKYHIRAQEAPSSVWRRKYRLLQRYYQPTALR